MKANAVELMGLGVPAPVANKFGNTYGGEAVGLVAVGTTRADALQLTKLLSAITTSSASTGVLLPGVAHDLGSPCVGLIYNASGQTINIFPDVSTNTVNGTTVVTLATGKTCMYFKISATDTRIVGLD